MRYTLLYAFILIFNFSNAQSLTIQVSSDSILLGNYLEVKFKYENATGEFVAPDFDDFQIIGGPNYSSSVQINNGVRNSSNEISYYIKPNEIGLHYITNAYLMMEDDVVLETNPIEINVYPNPEGIIENPQMDDNFFFKSFDFPFPSIENDNVPEKKKSKSKSKIRKI